MRKNLLVAFTILGSLVLAGCVAPVTGLRAVISAHPAQGEYPLAVTFDASRSSGDIVQYLWSFGDGATSTASDPTVAHTYADRGTYTVTLTVVARDGGTAQTEATVRVHSRRPQARFSVSPASDIRVGMTVVFDASASSDPDGAVVEYLWDFGDGMWTSTSAPDTTYAYREPGTYTVALVVKDGEGDLSDPATRSVAVSRGGCCGN